MKAIYINGVLHNVYREQSAPHGYVELTVGTDQPTAGHTVPAHWFNHGDHTRVYTGGNWYSHNPPVAA